MTAPVLSKAETTADAVRRLEAALDAARKAESDADAARWAARERREAAEKALDAARLAAWLEESRARHPTPPDAVELAHPARRRPNLNMVREVWQLWPDGRPSAIRARGVRVRCLIDSPMRARLGEQVLTLSRSECIERGVGALWERVHNDAGRTDETR